MADDLSNYKLQLQQVEVALLTDPENAELLKLKEDIGEICLLECEKCLNLTFTIQFLDQLITLQKELIKTTEVEQRKYVEPSGSAGNDRAAYYKDQKARSQSLKIWKVTDKCMARDTNGQ